MAEGTKDVTQAQERTSADLEDTVLVVNSETKEVQRLKLNNLGDTVAGRATIAPGDFDDFFGV